MGLFKRKNKEYTLGEALKIIAKEGNESLIPVAIHPGNPRTNYWIREEEYGKKQKSTTNSILKTQAITTEFDKKRENFISEVSGNGEYQNMPHDIHTSNSTKPGRVTRYNDYQSARNYQKKYGQYR